MLLWVMIFALALLIVLAVLLRCNRSGRVRSLDPVPASVGEGNLSRQGEHVVLHLKGTPREIGKQHGFLLRRSVEFLLNTYVRPNLVGPHGEKLLAAAEQVRRVLPHDYLEELDACAEVAGVDRRELLIAQCLGDLDMAVIGWQPPSRNACSSYVAFGPATVDGGLECGRNLDYFFGSKIPLRCSLVTYYEPLQEKGLRFASIGLSGILGGWTLINERGLIVANHVGGGIETRIDGIPTLILTRLIAQQAGTVDEAVAMIRRLPRMRGQIVWLAQDADETAQRPAQAVAVEYDAENVAVRPGENGMLVVTNENRALGEPPPRHLACGRYARLEQAIKAAWGRLDGVEPLTLLPGVANETTLQVVQIRPRSGAMRVWFRTHGSLPEVGVEHSLP